ncbi:hypothetical protein CH375_13420 [Leptospira ellisii]|nr:hypothetical protein CH375_13420 [Leptospira ellisii]
MFPLFYSFFYGAEPVYVVRFRFLIRKFPRQGCVARESGRTEGTTEGDTPKRGASPVFRKRV